MGLTRFESRFFTLTTLRFEVAGCLFYPIDKDRSFFGIGCSIKHLALKTLLTATQRTQRLPTIENEGILNCENVTSLLQSGRYQLAQRGVIVEYVETAAKGTEYQIVFSFLNRHVVYIGSGQAGTQFFPVNPFIHTHIHTVFGSGKEDMSIGVVF